MTDMARATPNPRTRRRDALVKVLLAGSAFVVIAVAVSIVGMIAQAGLRGFAHAGFFASLFGLRWSPEDTPPSFGFLPYLANTLLSATGAVLMGAVPAMLAAVYLAEMAHARVRRSFRSVMEVAAALPSVVYGYIALTYLVPRFANPHLGCQGLGLASASLVLAAMIAPTIALLSLDVLERTPRELRDASSALGVSRWHTTWHAVFPAARRGLVVAGFFGFARAVGETMAVQMVAGNGRYAALAGLRPAGARVMDNVCAHLGPLELFRPTSTISTRIVMDMPETQPGTPWNNVLFSMSLVLLCVSTLVVLITRRISRTAPT